MSDWKARLPAGKPPKGKAYAVLALKSDTGYRVEHVLTMDEDHALKVLQLSINADIFGELKLVDEESTCTKK